jgi:hypothetical protein
MKNYFYAKILMWASYIFDHTHISFHPLKCIMVYLVAEDLITKEKIVRTAVKKGWIIGLGEKQIFYYR